MALSFVLIKTRAGRESEVMKALKEKLNTNTVHTVVGPYDVVAVLRESDRSTIMRTVAEKVKPHPDVTAVVPLLVSSEEPKGKL